VGLHPGSSAGAQTRHRLILGLIETAVEVLPGNPAGIATLGWGLAQGLGIEVVMAISNYEIVRLWAAMMAGAAASQFGTVWTAILYGWDPAAAKDVWLAMPDQPGLRPGLQRPAGLLTCTANRAHWPGALRLALNNFALFKPAGGLSFIPLRGLFWTVHANLATTAVISIEASHITYTHWNHTEPTLKRRPLFQIRPGTLNVLVGPGGSGKTTAVRHPQRQDPTPAGRRL